MLSRNDIIQALADEHLKIFPLEKKNLTGIGYNLSTTTFAFSINRGVLLTIHQRITSQGIERYINVPGNDTVLFFSKEYIAIDDTLAGTFHSKVSRVCQGLGQISTTLDPTWKGQLIVSVCNPMSKSIIFELDKSSGNLLTMLLYKLNCKVTGPNIHDNNQGRCDLLLERFTEFTTKNKDYLEKHLELKEFVSGQFADSLNGYDDFIYESSIIDKYSQKIKALIELRERLENDSELIIEGNYMIGETGIYSLFKSNREKSLIKSCTLFEYKGNSDDIDISFRDVNKDEEIVIEKINAYIYIISYELEEINHIRRIDWQNKKIEEFAAEKSELVRLCNNEKKKRQLKGYWLPLGILFGLYVGIILFMAFEYGIESNKFSYIIAVIAPVLPVLVEHYLHKKRGIDK